VHQKLVLRLRAELIPKSMLETVPEEREQGV